MTPTVMLAEVNLKNALVVASAAGGRFSLGVVPPAQRRSLVELGKVWADNAQAWATSKMKPDSSKEAA